MQEKSLDRLRRLDGLLSQVLDLPPEKRREYLTSSSDEDASLRNEALMLLESDQEIEHLFDALAGQGATLSDATLPNGPLSGNDGALKPDPYELVNKTISNYHIIGVIGSGGMGIVYKGKDVRLNRYVALKFLSPRLLEDQSTRDRFINEARAASILDHPSIGIIHEIGETDDGRLFIAMTLYEGETLKSKMAAGRLHVDQILRYITQVAEGLEFSHRQGVIHRDIKPSNLIVNTEDRIKIVDFGLASFIDRPLDNDSGRIMGTVGYMAPEQLQGSAANASADIWACGVVLYEMLFGEKPKQSPDGSVEIETNSSSQSGSGRSLIASQLARIASRALQQKPADRYASMTVMLKELRQLQPAEPGSLLRKMAVSIIMRPVAAMTFAFILAALVFFVSTQFFTASPAENLALQPLGIELLHDYSSEAQNVYLSRGITEELLHELTRFDALKVVSLINSDQVQRTPEEFARTLNLNLMVQGSVFRNDERVRLSLQVRELDSNRIIASVNEEEDETDLQALIHDAALALVQDLDVPLTLQDEQRHADAKAIHPESFELYLRGRFHVEMETPDHLEQAIELFETATLKEPGFARAYASMVVPYYLLGDKYQRLPTEAAFYLAKHNAARALALDELLPEAHIAQGVVRELIDLDYDGAERSFKRAIELNPKESEARREYGLLLLRKGDIKAGISELHHSLSLKPASVQVHRDLGRAYYYNEEYDKAIEKLEELLEIQPDFVRAYKFLAFSYLEKGLFDKAEQAYSKALELDRSENEVDNVSFYAEIQAASGDIKQAAETIDRMIVLREQQGGGSASISLVYTRLGMLEEAMHWIRIGYEEQDLPPSINVDPRWIPLRDRAEFQEIAANAVH